MKEKRCPTCGYDCLSHLKSQKKEIVAMAEGMKTDGAVYGGDVNEESGYNKALEDIINKLAAV